MVAPVTSSTSTSIADNQQAADINVTSFGTPFLDVESVQVVTNLAPNGVNEGLRLRRTTSVSTGEQYAGGTSFTSTNFTGQIVYTSRRAKEGGINGEDFANGGYGCFMRDTSGNFRAWRFGGNDDGYDNDVMRTRVIDPEVTGDEIEDVGFDLTAVDAFGYYFTADRVSTNDAEWQILQTFYASDITVTRGDSTTPATWNDLADEMDNNAGDYDQVFMDKIGGNLYRGVAKYIIGANDANEHRFDQNSWALEFFQGINDIYDGGNGERYGAVIQDDSFSITIEVGSNFYLNWQNFVLRGIKQWSFEVNGNSNTTQTCNFTSGAIAGIGTNDFEAPANFQRCSFDDCDKLIINDATFNNGVISNPADGTCCQITTSSDIDNTSFTTDTPADFAIEITAAGSYALNGVTYSGFTTDINVTATTGTVNIVIGGGGDTPTTQTAGATVNVTAPTNTYTLTSDTAATLIRYFEDDFQTIVDSTTGTSLAYEFPDTDPIDAEFLKQGYVPVNRQNLTPVDGASLDIIMDFDESYNSAHGLVITTDYTYDRASKALSIVADQQALDVRSALADLIRTNSSYYNTPLLMVSIPGLTRVDLTNGMTISSMATWKGAGMERFDATDSSNPVEKWFCIKSVGDITGAAAYYRQTSSGNATQVTLTNNIVDEAFQYYRDDNHDGDTSDINEYDYSGYMVIKSLLAGSKEGRVDVLATAGLSALQSNLYTVGLANVDGGYSGTDPGISADITIVTGSTVGGVAFSYEIVDGGTNSGTNIANQIHYNKVNSPNSTVPGGTGLTWWELPDMVVFNGSNVETARGYEEGASPTLVGFYASRSGADHPDFARFQGDNGTYYVPATVAQISAPNLTSGRVQVVNETGRTASAWAATTAYSQYDKVLRSTGTGTESGIGLYFQCTTAGTTGGTEPTWDTTPGNTTADGTVTWTCRAIEFDNTTTAGAYSNSWTDHEDFDNGDTIRLRWIDSDELEIEAEGVATAAGTTTFLNTPEDDTVYDSYGIDGSTVTEYSADYPNVQVDITDPDNVFYIDRFYAWHKYNLTTADGIRNFFGAVTATDTSNLTINNSVVDIFFDNTKAVSARQGDTIVVQRADGAYPQVTTTSGGGGLGFYYAGIGYSTSSGSGLDTTERNKLLNLYDFDPTTYNVEGSETYQEAFRLIRAAVVGKAAVSGSTVTFRDEADTKNRITATTDANGQRTAVTVDGS